MPLYDVIWKIKVDQETPEKAAQLALEIQRDPSSEATHFEVVHPKAPMDPVHLWLDNTGFKSRAEIRAETVEQCLTRIDQFATEKQDCMDEIQSFADEIRSGER